MLPRKHSSLINCRAVLPRKHSCLVNCSYGDVASLYCNLLNMFCVFFSAQQLILVNHQNFTFLEIFNIKKKIH